MKVTEAVAKAAHDLGSDEAVEGAIVLAALDRPLDHAIQTALGLDCYHPGHPSPWSHCFLVAEPFNSKSPGATKILDCTIRDKKNRIIWNTPNLVDLIKTITNHAGKVYDETDGVSLGDYDDPRVLAAGVKTIDKGAASDRHGIVAAGRALRAEGIHYDFAGLFRELFAMLLHIKLPPDASYFCSAFCQEAYRRALGSGAGSKGDFLVGVDSHDVSPDDIWYSRTGLNFPDHVELPSLAAMRKKKGKHAKKKDHRTPARKRPGRRR